ncbi:Virulence factor [Albimonas donghaensis]|uniref:Virulence factor n=1 Tax=Albimonas donghaensis TaxID=356660 RepID=A0A1H3A4H2_9RHOB|nr:virulence factor [Albimonas donghaensis]SDX24662.1 Virulence factor [Albimonas donghaensis]
MAQITVVWWRDIPAQVIAGKGRRGGAKRQLPERFEQAIDRCAMKVGAKESDAYLAEWRRGAPYQVEAGSDEAAAEAEAARLDAEYGPEKIRALIANDGREPGDGAETQ